MNKIIEKIAAKAEKLKNLDPKEIARNEEFWGLIKNTFNMSPDFINLDNGYMCPQPSLGIEVLKDEISRINEMPSYYMRRLRDQERENIREIMADFAGCSTEEISICRNATEALDTIIFGIDMKAGDEALWGRYEYPNMRYSFEQKASRYGINNNIIFPPIAKMTNAEIVKAYEKAITPKTKVILVSHMVNLIGQILPVREICDMAHERGIEVIVDGAHTLAHMDYKISDLHCDYFGSSLHKWLCAPLGTGLMYIKRDKIKEIWPLFGDGEEELDDIRKFERIGTHPNSIFVTLEASLKFHNIIGTKVKEERLRFMKNYWAERIKELPNVKVNTPLNDEQSCGIASFSIEGKTEAEIVEYLFESHKIFAAEIDDKGMEGVRVTPNIYTSLDDFDLFVKAMEVYCSRP